MNFLGIFKTVVKDVGVVAKYGSFGISAFNPALGAIVGRIGSTMVDVEAQIPDDGKGPEKAAAVIQDFRASMSLTAALLAQTGRTMTWDEGKLKDVIDSQAKTFNLYAELAKSIKILDPTAKASPIISGQ